MSVDVCAQVARSNAQLLESKKAEAAHQLAEERRIAAYLKEKAEQEQAHSHPHHTLHLPFSPYATDLAKQPFLLVWWLHGIKSRA
jgi:hypothetical protein